MKIHPDHVEGVRPGSESQADKARQPREDFAEVLSGAVSQEAQASARQAAPLAPPVASLAQVQAVQAAQAAASGDEAVVRMEGILERWENYAANLREVPGASLRSAWAELEGISGEVEQVKGLTAGNPGLRGLADELEVLAVTERIKFNRGDYQ